MTLHSLGDLQKTQRKLRLVEKQYEAARVEPGVEEHIREVEMQSLKGLINQLKEEIVRFEAHLETHARPE